MADAIVSFAVQKLGDFLIRQIDLLQNVRSDIAWLQSELSYMRSFIKDAEEKQWNDHSVRQWVSETLDIADDAVNILDDFTLKIEDDGPGARKVGVLGRVQMCACFPRKEANLYVIGTQIGSLKDRVLDISRKRETYGIQNLGDPGEVGAPQRRRIVKTIRRSTSYLEEGRLFVGFEDVTGRLVEELLKDEPRRGVVSIVGTGGLGKTTVARELYNSPIISHKFLYRAWVCVSQEYSTLDLLQTILKSFRKKLDKEELERLEKMNIDDLEHEIREILKNQRYLIVVDDVWHAEAWESLKRAFPDYKNGSRIIVTTRRKDIATRTDEKCFVHELRFLTPEESWNLFCGKLSWGVNYTDWCSTSMLDLGREMVNKCGGLPLAITVLGGLLSHKKRLEEWLRVKEHLWRHVKNYSAEISPLLSLSYNDLPGELKQCFLYIGMFPEDYMISAEKLTWMWIAEGFIQGEERVEDIAEDYLNELIDRSLIQVAERFWGKTFSCKIHDLLRDLAVEKAKEVSLFDIYDPRRYTALPSCRRIAIHNHVRKYLSLGSLNRNLKSMLLFDPDHEDVEIGLFASACQQFKYLRVLDLEKVRFQPPRWNSSCTLSCIENLVHLKYLGLTKTDIDQLPKSIGKLKSLEILEALFSIHTTCMTSPELSKLTNLRHIFCRLDGDLNVSNLTNLRTLRYVHYDQWTKVDTSNLVNLEELAIENIGPINKEIYSLDTIGKLKNLRNLLLGCSENFAFPSLEPLSSCHSLIKLWLYGRIENQSWLEHIPQSVTELNFSKSWLKEDPMPILERLQNLKSLELDEAYNGNEIVCHDKGFPQLEFLCLAGFQSLERWHLENGALPVLRGLGIDECPMLKIIPERLKSVPFLKKSEVSLENINRRPSILYEPNSYKVL